jgi:uncharacterized protein YggE
MNSRLTILVAVLVAVLASHSSLAQVGGGSVYAGGRGSARDNAEASERAKRTVAPDEKPPSASSVFLDASVLINVTADEYVAIFGVSEEGATPEECGRKADAVIRQFSTEVKSLGVGAGDLFVDYVAQNKIYGYDIVGDVAKQKLAGFEMKKNVSIHFKDKLLLDRLVAAAARSQIFDLIKVDYVVRNIGAVHTKLMEAAAGVIRLKAANRERFLGVKLRPSPQVHAEKYSAYYPTDMYDSYTAFESEDVESGAYRQRFTIQNLRKNRTFYFNGLSPKSFDRVVNPIMLEPPVQFTLYLKLKYEMVPGGPPARNPSGRAR